MLDLGDTFGRRIQSPPRRRHRERLVPIVSINMLIVGFFRRVSGDV